MHQGQVYHRQGFSYLVKVFWLKKCYHLDGNFFLHNFVDAPMHQRQVHHRQVPPCLVTQLLHLPQRHGGVGLVLQPHNLLAGKQVSRRAHEDADA